MKTERIKKIIKTKNKEKMELIEEKVMKKNQKKLE